MVESRTDGEKGKWGMCFSYRSVIWWSFSLSLLRIGFSWGEGKWALAVDLDCKITQFVGGQALLIERVLFWGCGQSGFLPFALITLGPNINTVWLLARKFTRHLISSRVRSGTNKVALSTPGQGRESTLSLISAPVTCEIFTEWMSNKLKVCPSSRNKEAPV